MKQSEGDKSCEEGKSSKKAQLKPFQLIIK